MEDKTLQKFNVKFTNKTRPRSVRVKTIHDQHQIDILSLLDVFSRFHWLYPLESKHRGEVKKTLKKVYFVHGLPQKLQSDNGGEFKKNVKEFYATLRHEVN